MSKRIYTAYRVCNFENSVEKIYLLKRGNVYYLAHMHKEDTGAVTLIEDLRIGASFDDAKRLFLIRVSMAAEPFYTQTDFGMISDY